MVNIAVLVSGGGTNLQAVIDATESKEINGEVKLVISNKEGVFALERAKKHNIRALTEKDNEKILALMEEENIDLIVLAGYLKILPEALVKKYKNKIINIHPSLIPSFCGMGYYGSKVHEAVIKRGVKFTGATVHFVDEGADTGPIIMQAVVKVDQDDDASSIAKKVLVEEHKILKDSIRLFCLNKLDVKDGRVYINE